MRHKNVRKIKNKQTKKYIWQNKYKHILECVNIFSQLTNCILNLKSIYQLIYHILPLEGVRHHIVEK